MTIIMSIMMLSGWVAIAALAAWGWNVGTGKVSVSTEFDWILFVGGAIEARFVASVRGYGSHAGAHLHLGHVIRLLHELDGLLERIWAGEGRDGTVRGDGERTRAADRFAFWRGSLDGDGGSAVTTREDGARTLGLFLGELGLFGRREGVGGVWGGHVRLAVL
jgi:hypothetical protein